MSDEAAGVLDHVAGVLPGGDMGFRLQPLRARKGADDGERGVVAARHGRMLIAESVQRFSTFEELPGAVQSRLHIGMPSACTFRRNA